MRNKFTWFGIIAILLLGTGICFVGCKDEVNAVVHYVGKVMYSGTTTPFAELEVKVTNGDKIHCVTHTDKDGGFALSVKVNEIDGSYYLLAGDSTCVPKKVTLHSYGQEKVDLGVIDVEGPTLPVVSTASITNITTDKAVSGGNVTADGRSTVTARGVCWSKTEDPTVNDSHTTNGSGTGAFESQLTGLDYNTVYYVRAYATNRLGTAYGNQVKFCTLSGKVEVLTDSVYAVTAVSAKCAGTVVDDGGYKVTARGVCWAKSPDPTTTDYIANEGSGKGAFVCALRNLDINAVYYVRAFATNETGTVYGEQVKIQTLDGMATVITSKATEITAESAIVGGNVSDDGSLTVTNRGVCYSKTQFPSTEDAHTTDGKGKGIFTSVLKNLTPATTYFYRAYATTSEGTAYGEHYSFTTATGLPIVSTAETTANSVQITTGGNVTSDGGYSITARGVCYSTNNSTPTISDSYTTAGVGVGNYTSIITQVSLSTTYYVRAYATNQNGTAYGGVVTVTTGNGLPTVETTNAKSSGVVILSGGNVTDDGGFPVIERGVCYGSFPNPDLSSTFKHTSDGSGTGYYTSNLGSSLSGDFYIRAYATNDIGTAYGNQIMASISYLSLPSFEFNGYTYRVAPTSKEPMKYTDAHNYCSDLDLYGYSDWFVPFHSILNFMYLNRSSIGGFNGSKYWERWESGPSYYYIDFTNGNCNKNTSGGSAYVRPIRAEK